MKTVKLKKLLHTKNSPDGIYAIHIRILIFVDDDVSRRIQQHAASLQSHPIGVTRPHDAVVVIILAIIVRRMQRFRIGHATRRHDDHVGAVYDVPAHQRHVPLPHAIIAGVRIEYDLGYPPRATVYEYSRPTHLDVYAIAQHRIERPQRLVVPQYQMHLGTQRVQYAREFDCDVSGTTTATSGNVSISKNPSDVMQYSDTPSSLGRLGLPPVAMTILPAVYLLLSPPYITT